MTRLPQMASLLVALSLLTSAAAAYADCAWVLWMHWGGGLVRQQDGSVYNPHQWQVVDAFQSREACVTTQRSTTLSKGYDRSLCLPDTVKPEGSR